MLRFQEHLLAAGLNATIRRSRGRDIQAACGQLALATASLATVSHAGAPAANAPRPGSGAVAKRTPEPLAARTLGPSA
jgi:hypothetical protein